MHINYNSFILRKITGVHEEIFYIEKDISVEKLICMLSIKYGATFKDLLFDEENKKLKMLVLLNGGGTTGINYKITDKDTVNIVPLVAGG